MQGDFGGKGFSNTLVRGLSTLGLLGACALVGACGGSEADVQPPSTSSAASTGAGGSTSNSAGVGGGGGSPSTGATGGAGGGSAGKLGPVVGTYFVEWGIYGRDFHVADIPASKLTHILYGFIPICGPNDSLKEANPSGHALLLKQCANLPDFSVTIHDEFAALDKVYPEGSPGNFGQLKDLKAKHPDLKVLPSVGGWTLSDPFFSMAATAEGRKVFVDSMMAFIKKHDIFDGVDIDWEYPGGGGANKTLGASEDAANYALLMKDLREGLDALSKETGRTYELTSAVGCAPARIKAVDYQAAMQHIDYIFAMTYDFYGAWSNDLGHMTGLYGTENNGSDAGFNASAAIDGLMAAGVPASKLVMGAAMYGRAWTGVTGVTPSGSPFTGMGGGAMKGSWEPGVLDYKHIVKDYAGEDGMGKAGFAYSYDEKAEAPYLFNSTTGELITYDNPRSVKAKRDFAAKRGLAGMFSWEIDADNGDILDAMKGQ